MSKATVNPNSTIAESRATVFSAFALKTDQGPLVELYLNVSSKDFVRLYAVLIYLIIYLDI